MEKLLIMEKEKSAQHKLFIGSIPTDVTEKELRENFSRYGNITDLIIIKDKHSKKSRGFGFITFKEKRSLKLILKERHRLRDTSLEVKPAEPKKTSKLQEVPDLSSITKIFVGGIPKNAGSAHLEECFGKYGEIVEAAVIEDKKTNEQRGFGFINFKNVDSVKKVLEDFSSHHILGKWVECKVALPKSISDPTTNAEFTLVESSSDDDQEILLKPAPNLEKEVQTIQHSSVPHLFMPSKMAVSQKDMKSQSKIRQRKKADKRPCNKKQTSKLQTFDFGDFVADYEVEEDEILNKISYDPNHLELEVRANDDGRLSKERPNWKNHLGSEMNLGRPREIPQRREVISNISQWTEILFDEKGRQVEYKFSQYKRPIVFSYSKKFQPSVSMQDGSNIHANVQHNRNYFIDYWSETHGIGSIGPSGRGVRDDIGVYCRGDQPGDWQGSATASAHQSPAQLSYHTSGPANSCLWGQPHLGSEGFGLQLSPAPHALDGARFGHPGDRPTDNVLRDGNPVVGDTKARIELIPQGPSRICSEYKPPQEERHPHQKKVCTQSDNLITIKEWRRDALFQREPVVKKYNNTMTSKPVAVLDSNQGSIAPNNLQFQFSGMGMYQSPS